MTPPRSKPVWPSSATAASPSTRNPVPRRPDRPRLNAPIAAAARVPGARTRAPKRWAAKAAGTLAATAPIETLASAASALFLLVFGFVNLALWRLHRRAGHRGHKGFRAPRWVPPVGCVLSFALILALFAA